jgi:hypothetical protein
VVGDDINSVIIQALEKTVKDLERVLDAPKARPTPEGAASQL